MKLNYKRTILVGFAFFLICTFWQAYDTIIPKILTDKFGMTQTLSGIIMALDNILALFLLPLFGGLSDKCKSKLGRRKPYVLVGTLIAVVAFFALSAVDYMQLNKNIRNVTEINSMSLEEVYDLTAGKELKTADGTAFTLSEKYTKDEFAKIPAKRVAKDGDGRVMHYSNGERVYLDNEDYLNYVVPARLAANPKAEEAYREIYAHQGEGKSGNWFVNNILKGGRDPQTPDGESFKLTEKYPTVEERQHQVQDQPGLHRLRRAGASGVRVEHHDREPGRADRVHRGAARCAGRHVDLPFARGCADAGRHDQAAAQ